MLEWLSDPPVWFDASSGALIGGVCGAVLLRFLGALWPFDDGVFASPWVLWPVSVIVVGGLAVTLALANVVAGQPIYRDPPLIAE